MLGIRLEWFCSLIPVFAYFIYKWFKPWIRAAILASKLPGPPSIPFFGNLFMTHTGTEMLELFTTSYKKFGPIYRAWISFFPMIIVIEPKYIQLLLTSNKLTEKSFFYALMPNFVGKGLISNNGIEWKSHRKYIQPYFNINILQEFIPTFVEGSQIFLDTLKNVTEIKISASINTCFFDMFHGVVLGIPFEDEMTKRSSPFNQAAKSLLDRFAKPWLLLDFIYNLTSGFQKDKDHKESLFEYTQKILQKLKTQRKCMKVTRWSYLEYLLQISENNADFTEDDAINEAATLMLAGQDSVSAATSFTLYYLAKHPDIQYKVICEIEKVLQQSAVINMTTLNEMKYLEQCIKEALRLCPSGPLLSRKLLEDVKLGEHVLPAGCLLVIAPIATHRVPQYYPDPEVYNPDRFSDANQETRNPFAYLAFSAGPRNCIGAKLATLAIKTLIATLLRNYELSLPPGKEEIVAVFKLTLKARGGIWLKLTPRNHT